MAMSDGLRRSLDRLVGTWRSEGRVVGGDGAGDTWGGVDVYEWFPGGAHLVHRVDVEIFGGRTEALEFFTPRPDGDEFDQVSYDGDGRVSRAIGSFDDRGRYLNVAEQARATLEFLDADRMHAVWEQRDDNGAWNEWMRVDFTRVGAPRIEVRSKSTHLEHVNAVDLVELAAADAASLAAARDFYTAAFGWSFTAYGPEYADTQSGGVAVGLNAVDDAHRHTAPLLVVKVADVDAARDATLAAGGALVHDVYDFPGGRRFHVTDPAGNEIAAWSE
jgi:predicted enzyme related to lactoylglutathione lyase